MKKSTFLHLRFPFSFFLLPVFLFACAVGDEVYLYDLIITFLVLHIFVYPASNGYNSYFDKDEDSIGGLEKPPEVSKELYNVSLLMDLAGIALAVSVSITFAVLVIVYGMISKAYSHPSIRLKKMPFVGWLAAGIFQGYFTFVMTLVAVSPVSLTEVFVLRYQIPAILSTLLLFGSYPMTQVYQHEEDARRGDLTISRVLGVLGTFHFTALSFVLSVAGFIFYFTTYYSLELAIVFLVLLFPVLFYFLLWYKKARKDRKFVDFKHTMNLNLISAICLNIFFVSMWGIT